jgi:hypothetical protein
MSIELNGMKRTYEELIAQALGESGMKTDERSSRDNDRGNWYGNTSWSEAVSKAQNGDIAGAAALQPLILAGATKVRMEMGRLDPVYRLDEGRWIDVARFVKGEPECWGDMVEVQEQTVRRSVSVVINTCVSASVNSKDMDRVAVAVGSAVLGLQSSGYTVSLYLAVVNSGYDAGKPWIIGAPINQGGAPLDIARLSAVLRPWFFRRILFSVWETASAEQRRTFSIVKGGGYGRVGNLKDKDAQRITGDKNAIMVDIADYIGNEAGIKRRILEAMTVRGK